MSTLTRVTGAALAATVVLGGLATALPTAHAAATPVTKAVDYVVANATTSSTSAGSNIDVLFAYAAGGSAYAKNAADLWATTKPLCDAAGNAILAAKCAIAADVMNDRATATGYLAKYASGPFNAYAFGTGLQGIAYARTGVAVPPELLGELQRLGTPDATGKLPLDADFGKQLDSAGLVLDALLAMPTKDATTNAAITGVTNYILANQSATTSLWPDFSPTNTTGMVAGAIAASGPAGAAAAQKATNALVAAQLPDGSFGKGGCTGGVSACDVPGTKSDLFATVQAVLALTPSRLATLTAAPVPATPPPSPTTPPVPAPLTGTATLLSVADAQACMDAQGTWVVVENDGVLLRRGCVKGDATTSALTALKALTADVATKDTSFGPQICTIDGVGTCDWDPVKQTYWAFWSGVQNSEWAPATIGADTMVAPAAGFLGFNWSTGVASPAPVSTTDAPFPAPVVDTTTPGTDTTTNPQSTPADQNTKPGLAKTGLSLAGAR